MGKFECAEDPVLRYVYEAVGYRASVYDVSYCGEARQRRRGKTHFRVDKERTVEKEKSTTTTYWQVQEKGGRHMDETRVGR
jgi:hypothetical protein